ncbi:MAG: D-alanine--D-alanine ligase, partial [Halofilum sp. (in: g-proteobacteria)]
RCVDRVQRDVGVPHRGGEYPLAAKIMVRVHGDAIVARSPTSADLEAVRSRYPEARVQVLAPAGTRLAHLRFQDSYSFEVAEIFLGGGNRKELLAKARDIERLLGFEFQPLAESEIA